MRNFMIISFYYADQDVTETLLLGPIANRFESNRGCGRQAPTSIVPLNFFFSPSLWNPRSVFKCWK